MSSIKSCIFFILTLLLLSACGSTHRVQSNLPKPGKQCKSLIDKKFITKKNKQKRKRKRRKEEPTKINPTHLQAQLMTDKQYQDQIEKVQKSLPEFDAEKDCPPAFNKPANNKKSGLRKFFEKIF